MDQKINVCLLNDSFPPVIDGVANCVLNYADILQRKYGDAVVAVPHYPGVVDDYPYTVVRYPSIDTTRSIGYRTGIPYWPSAIRELVKQDIDIIHTHCPFVSTLTARMLRSYLNVPIVLTYHTKFDIDIKHAIDLGFLRSAAIKFIVSNIEACDEVWVVSEGAGENLRSLGYTGTYSVMQNGVDFPRGPAAEDDIASVSSQYRLDPGVPVFLFVGRMMWYKNIRLILDGLRQAKLGGTRFKMLFVGVGADAEEIMDVAKKLDLAEDCIFTGRIEERQTLRALFSRADLFVFPSTFDTNGLVVREAAACGLPSILVRGSSAAEGLEDGRHGMLIEETPAALGSALAWAAQHPEQLKEMGRNAMNEIYVSWEEAVDAAVARYPDIMEKYRMTQRRSAFHQVSSTSRFLEDIDDAFQKLREYRKRLIKMERQHRLHLR